MERDEPAVSAEQDPEDPPISEDGVDVTLIRWMLSLTPAERLEVLQEHLWSVLRLRAGNTEAELPGNPPHSDAA